MNIFLAGRRLLWVAWDADPELDPTTILSSVAVDTLFFLRGWLADVSGANRSSGVRAGTGSRLGRLTTWVADLFFCFFGAMTEMEGGG